MRQRLSRFFRAEHATASIEFVIAFPVVFLMFLVTLELTFLMARNTLLQQALDVTMRDVRLGTIVDPTRISLEDRVCDRMPTISDCRDSLALEFTEVNQQTFAMPGQRAPCARRSIEDMTARANDTYETGEQNALIVVRACMVVDTITPVMTDAFDLFARTALVIEPTE